MPKVKKNPELEKLSLLLDERVAFVEALTGSSYYSSFPQNNRFFIDRWLQGAYSYKRTISDNPGDADRYLENLKDKLGADFEGLVNNNDPRIKVLNALIVEQKRIMDIYHLREEMTAANKNGYNRPNYIIMTQFFCRDRVPTAQSKIALVRAEKIGELAKKISEDIVSKQYLSVNEVAERKSSLYLELNQLRDQMQGTTTVSKFFRISTGKSAISRLAEAIKPDKPKIGLKSKIAHVFKRPGNK